MCSCSFDRQGKEYLSRERKACSSKTGFAFAASPACAPNHVLQAQKTAR